MEVRRFYVQNGQTIENSKPEFSEGELSDFDSITDEFCAESKMLYGDYNDHDIKGGLQVKIFNFLWQYISRQIGILQDSFKDFRFSLSPAY